MPSDGNRRPVAVDLFAGAGGFALGLEQAGFDVVAAVEYDPVHAAAHSFNFPRTEVVCTDAHLMEEGKLREAVVKGVEAHGRADAWDGAVDLVFGGPPCQGFSSGGKRDPDDERNLLVFDFKRLVVEIGARYFVLENVPPLRNFLEGRDSKMLDRLIAEFEAEGYRVLAPTVLHASRYGVPQDRRRLIVVGHREGEPPPEYPGAAVRPVPKRRGEPSRPWEVGGREEDEALPVGPTVWEAIGDLPDLDGFEELWRSDEVKLTKGRLARMEKAASPYVRRLRGMDADGGDLSYPRQWDRRVLTASMRTAHSLDSIRRFAKTEQGASEDKSRFYRLDEEGLCSTVRAGTGYERGSFMAPRPIHPRANRVISVREAARLHSFPDWFRFHATKWHGFRQIGNSLPPLLGRAIGRELVRAMGASPAKPSETVELGDPGLLTLGTADAAERLGADLAFAPSHKLRIKKKPKADAAGQPGERKAA